MADDIHGYVAMHDLELASYGESCSITGLILLDLQDNTSTRLEPVADGLLLKSLIDQNFSTKNSPLQIFQRLKKITSQSKCFKLTYSNVAEASDLLIKEFDGKLTSQNSPSKNNYTSAR